MSLLTRCIHGAVGLSCLPAYKRFMKGAGDPGPVQERILLDILHRNRECAYGRKHRFSAMNDYAGFASRVPVVTYDDIRETVESVSTVNNPLCSEPVRLFEPTSGSAARVKLIPYTRTLGIQFAEAVRTWLFDLYHTEPVIRTGAGYWSVSPVGTSGTPFHNGIPVGFDDDTAYAGRTGTLLNAVMAVPSAVRLMGSMHDFRYATLRFLAARGDLSLISVWNPTFMSLILEQVAPNRERLVSDVADGTISLPDGSDLPAAVRRPRPDRMRAAELEHIFADSGSPGPGMFRRIWPHLALVSCWADGASAGYARDLARLLPGVRMQPKGVTATEGMISIPLAAADGCVPAYQSHFYEFAPCGGGNPVSLHRVESGAEYTVLLTTGGGLYRYDIGDRVRVERFFRGLPVLAFRGREHVVDQVGEKLNEVFVKSVLDRVLSDAGLNPQFLMMAPEENGVLPAYAVFLQDETVRTGIDLAVAVDDGLRENYHYEYARKLGQLAAPRVFRIRSGGTEAYLERCRAEGMRSGDIKPVVLDRRKGWSGAFTGIWAAEGTWL